jgi:hypothetical protein
MNDAQAQGTLSEKRWQEFSKIVLPLLPKKGAVA